MLNRNCGIKILHIALFVIFLFLTGCKDKPSFVAPTYVFMKWSDSVRKLDYRSYSECELFPKEKEVFMDMYGKFYFDDVFVTEVDDDNDKNIREDSRGYKYKVRNVNFECRRIMREGTRVLDIMKGQVEFVRFSDGPDAKRGWLMFNRTITRIGLTK